MLLYIITHDFGLHLNHKADMLINCIYINNNARIKVEEKRFMLSPELKKLLTNIQMGEEHIEINPEKLRTELEALESNSMILQHSLSMSPDICPTCRRPL